MGLFSSSRNSTTNTTEIDVHSNPNIGVEFDLTDGLAQGAQSLKEGLMNTSALLAFVGIVGATLFIIGRR